MATGITKRHSKGCAGREPGGRCTCGAGWQATVHTRDGKRIRRGGFETKGAAEAWLTETRYAIDRGGLRAPKPTTIRQAWDEWYEGAKAGKIRNRSGDPYKPSALRSYERAMRLRVLDELGGAKLNDVTRPDLQRFADGLTGIGPSATKCTLLPLRAIFNRAVDRGDLVVNPCNGLRLPAVRGGRDRIASPAEAAKLIAAAPERDRALWATAMYAGLRCGELQALRVENIDLASGLIQVEDGWDEKEGVITPKSDKGRRRVPIAGILRDHLLEHVMAKESTGLAFRTADVPFYPKTVQERADTAWRKAGLKRITPHECRHTFASLMIAAGVNAKALSTYMGHANISITLDRYGHLMPGSESEAGSLLDEYLSAQAKRAEEAARRAGTELHATQTATQIAVES
jgi:integrase